MEVKAFITILVILSAHHMNYQQFRAPQWTKDEKICGRCVSNEIQFHEDGDLSNLLLLFFIILNLNLKFKWYYRVCN